MTTISLTDPVNGTTADATLIANNNSQIEGAVNGGIDATNFGPGKILAPSKLTQEGAVTGAPLRWIGSQWETDLPYICAVTRTTAQSIPTNTETAIDFTGTEIHDPFNMHTSGTSSRITFAQPGMYLITGYAAMQDAADASWTGSLRIRRNGTTTIAGQQAEWTTETTRDRELNVMMIIDVSGGDYVELTMTQSGTGGAVSTQDSTNGRNPKFAVYELQRV